MGWDAWWESNPPAYTTYAMPVCKCVYSVFTFYLTFRVSIYVFVYDFTYKPLFIKLISNRDQLLLNKTHIKQFYSYVRLHIDTLMVSSACDLHTDGNFYIPVSTLGQTQCPPFALPHTARSSSEARPQAWHPPLP